MRNILSLLFVLILSTVSAFAASLEEKVEAHLDGLVRLEPKKEGINLRSGPGTTFENVGQTYNGLSFLASPDTVADAEGKAWYKILYTVERQEDTAYFDQDPIAYIRSDLVRVSPLTDMDRERVASYKFGILNISPEGLPTFTLEQPVILVDNTFSPTEVEVPAGTPLVLFASIFMSDGVAYLPVYEAYGTSGIHGLGEIKLADFEALSFATGEEGVRNWLETGKRQAGLN